MLVRILLLIQLLSLAACGGPQLQLRPDRSPVPATLQSDAMVMPDGYRLPLRRWLPMAKPRAMVLALHGFNDYSNAFTETASYLMEHSIAMYAIDQRGFGRTIQTGLWAGSSRMQDDLLAAAELLCQRYPHTPLYLFGESMGGAVILSLATRLEQTCAAGVILAAPAVWGWETMPWWQGSLLRLAAHVAPAVTVTGEGLDIRPSDNSEMLRALGADPLVIKATRFDTIYGLTNLMQAAFAKSLRLRLPTLLLYPDGFHMLTRDLQAEVVLADIAAWIHNSAVEAPSGMEVKVDGSRLKQLCDGQWSS